MRFRLGFLFIDRLSWGMIEKGRKIGMKRILIVEDDRDLSHGLCMALRDQEVEIVQAYDLKSATCQLKEEMDLILLDVNLPDGNGLQFLEQVRKQSEIPIILLTANDTELDVVMGLENGADDYITKPFSLAILRARVGAQLRRAKTVKQYKIEIDSYSFDFEKMEFKKDGTLIGLSKTEQKLLRLFVENRGVTLTRNFLVDRIWTDGEEYVDENALSVTVKRLRDKLDAGGYIKTVYGVGYVWKKQQVNAGKG